MEPVAIEGYVRCNCGCNELVVEYLAWQTGGRGLECWIANRTSKLKEIEVINRGRRIPAKIPDRVVKQSKASQKYKHRTDTARKVGRAEDRALRRLRMVFPEVYDVIYTEERHKEGLPPLARMQKNHLELAVQTKDIDMAYASATDSGAVNAAD